MLRYYIQRSSKEDFQLVTTPPARDVWIHGDEVTIADLEKLADRYGMDLNVLRDVLDRHELPRVELQDGGLYVFIRTARRGAHSQVITTPLLLAVKDTIFVNISAGTIDNQRLMTPSALAHNGDATGLLLATLAAVVGEYEVLMQRTGRFIKDTGQRLRTHEVTNSDFIKFVTVEDNLNEYRMNLNGMLVVSQRLSENLRESDESEAIEDIVLYIRQLLVAIESHGQSITSIRNAYGTIANNVLNQRMKTLTVLTLLVALPNVFYGMYGMNVPLPFQDDAWAYSAIVLFTLLLILFIYLLAKRRRLL